MAQHGAHDLLLAPSGCYLLTSIWFPHPSPESRFPQILGHVCIISLAPYFLSLSHYTRAPGPRHSAALNVECRCPEHMLRHPSSGPPSCPQTSSQPPCPPLVLLVLTFPIFRYPGKLLNIVLDRTRLPARATWRPSKRDDACEAGPAWTLWAS